MRTLFIKSLLTPGRLRRRQRRVNSLLKGGMVRQAHHDICHPEPVEGWQRGARGDFLIYVNSILRLLNNRKI
jgi:hypothetical protein